MAGGLLTAHAVLEYDSIDFLLGRDLIKDLMNVAPHGKKK